MQVTLVDLHALWVSTVPTGLHASSLLIAATLQDSGLLSLCHRLGSRYSDLSPGHKAEQS